MNNQQDRDNAILECRAIVSKPFVCLDTETNRGPKDNPEAVQIGIVNQDGEVAETLVKPVNPIDAGTTAIHHITNDMVKDAPDFMAVYRELLDVLRTDAIIMYNAPFDTGVLCNSARAVGILNYKVPSPVKDAMILYSKFDGEWDYKYNHCRWHKLGEACRKCGIELAGSLHGAAVDAEMTRRLVVYMAEQKLSTEEQNE